MSETIKQLKNALLTNRLLLEWEGFEERQIPFQRLRPRWNVAPGGQREHKWYYGALEEPCCFTDPGSERMPTVIVSWTGIARGLRGDIYRARLAAGGPSFILKIAHEERYSSRGHLHFEAAMYSFLHTETDVGHHIPDFFGVWTATNGMRVTMLILEDVGKPGHGLSFAQYSSDQKATLVNFATELHRWGVHHNDLSPRNIAVSAPYGEPVRVFDFSESCYWDDFTKDGCWEKYCHELFQINFKCQRDGTGTAYDRDLDEFEDAHIDQNVHNDKPPF